MLSAGMPELKKATDIQELVGQMKTEMSEREAAKYFKNLI
jgi:hypothetical protein